MSDFMATTNTFQFDSLDPVDAVLKTDDRFEDAMASAGSVNEVINAVEEAGYILEGRVDERVFKQPLSGDTYDVFNPVDLSLMREEETYVDNDEDDEEELYDDGELIDEVLDGPEDYDPGSAEDEEDNDMIDTVIQGGTDPTECGIGEGYFGWGVENEFISESDCCTSDAAELSDDDEDEDVLNEFAGCDDPFECNEF